MKSLQKIFILTLLCNSIYAEYTVQTSSGVVEGKKIGRLIHWSDIPYAQPPIGKLRWKAPRRLTDQDKIILPKNDNYCVQRPSNLGGPGGEGMFVGSEDCLYLDIVSPVNKKSKNLPVMFWIHGGGNTSGLKDLYDFNKMAKKHNVIIVRINYRLGPFGWFTHPAIQGMQDGLDKTSNFGTLDIITALKWVNENISLFYGDPNNVTVFGESAGGHNVLSLLVSDKAQGLFHKAISMSGYTTSISNKDAYKQNKKSSTSNYTSSNVVKRIINDQVKDSKDKKISNKEVRDILLNLSTIDFFKHYAEREVYEEIPLLTADGITLPKKGLRKSLLDQDIVNNVPMIIGSNRDEVKLWLSTAEYFIDLDYSSLGSLLGIPKVVLKNENTFNAFNYYRSSAWKIRGVDLPSRAIYESGNNQIYAYRYDWDDHRKYFIADFQKLIGSAHATEIPLLTGNTKLVGGYPLSSIIYPKGFSRNYLSKNMMKFWSNFAKNGYPGFSTNSIEWNRAIKNSDDDLSYMILDNKKKLRIQKDRKTFKSLSDELFNDQRLTSTEKCVVLLQMFTFVGDDLYDENINDYPEKCDRYSSEQFLIDNASFIEF